MIFIEFPEPVNDRKWKRWRSDCKKASQEVSAHVKSGRAPSIKDTYKRKSIKEKFYFYETGPFYGKCAYCETYLKHFQNPDIEHYRPKLGVTDENDVPVMVDYGDGEVAHKGYYWLAYDWHNLLPSCAKCNQASTIEGEKFGKHNRFPVKGSHARSESEISSERPLLLNPLLEDPALFIRINTKDGAVEAKDPVDRGNTTIRLLGLNMRDQLRQRRLGKIREVKALLVSAIHEPERRDEVLAELLEMRQGKCEYTAAVRAILDEIGPVFQNLC